MNQGLIPARYAKALYEYAAEKGDDSRVFTLMQTLAASFAAEPGLAKVMDNPFAAPAQKLELLRTAAGVRPGECAVFDRFLDLLAANRRLDCARAISLSYMDYYRRRHNIRLVKVVSAAPLDPTLEKRLKDVISRHLDGATMEYSTAIDPALIGGFTVSIDNEKLDASVAGELAQLRRTLMSHR